MSGVDTDGRQIRKGAAEAIEGHVTQPGGSFPPAVRTAVETIAMHGGTPLVVAEGKTVLGVIHRKDVVKGGIKERFAGLRRMGINMMITGDNQKPAAAIPAEAGVDDFLCLENAGSMCWR